MNNAYNINILDSTKESKNKLIISMNGNDVLSYYEDDCWDLSNKLLTNNSSKIKSINFKQKTLNNGEKLLKYPFLYEALKDVTYKMIVSGEKTQTIYHKVNRIILFLSYVVEVLNKRSLSSVNISEIEGYFKYLTSKKSQVSKSVILGYLNAVKMFFKYRNELKHNIDFEPFLDVKPAVLSSHKESVQKEIISDKLWQKITRCCEEEINNFLKNKNDERVIIEHYVNKINRGMKLKARDIAHESIYFREKYKNISNHKDYLEDIQYYGGILVQAYTGMRISELLSLKENCILKEKYKSDNFDGYILKIKGITFKYEDSISIDVSEGKNADWYCPELLVNVIEALSIISKYTTSVLNSYSKNGCFSKDIDDKKGNLFVSVKKPIAKIDSNSASFTRFDLNYQEKIKKLGIEPDIKITSHCFRRTFARFLARSLLQVEVDIIKDQFKHFSKDITLYYMRESEKLDSEFSELIEGYIEAKENNDYKKQKLLYEKMDSSIQKSILTANNFEELEIFMAGRQLKVVNEYSATINDVNKAISPLECLTCEGNIILPNIHKEYWEELMAMYNELIKLEPNAIRFKQERLMVQKVLNKLNNKEAYITGVQK